MTSRAFVFVYQTIWRHVVFYLATKLHEICSFVFIYQTTRRHTTDDRNFIVGKTTLTLAVPTNKIVGIIAFGCC